MSQPSLQIFAFNNNVYLSKSLSNPRLPLLYPQAHPCLLLINILNSVQAVCNCGVIINILSVSYLSMAILSSDLFFILFVLSSCPFSPSLFSLMACS